MLDTTRSDVRFAISVMEKATGLARRVQAQMTGHALTKQDRSPVTVADFAVQALVAHALEEAFPGALLVGEESTGDFDGTEGASMLAAVTRFVGEIIEGASPAQVCEWIDRGAAAPADRFWTLDPIDGTKGFLRGDQYATALARIEGGEVVFGALACPNLGKGCEPDMGRGVILIACRGGGAWCSVAGATFQPLNVSPCEKVPRARMLRSVESGHTNTGEIGALAGTMGLEADPVLMDSQAKYALLAAGGAELLFRLLSPKQPDYKEKIWDQAAGAMILEEAGGRVTDLDGVPLDFGQGRTLAHNTGIFASNGPLHDAGLRALAEIRGDSGRRRLD